MPLIHLQGAPGLRYSFLAKQAYHYQMTIPLTLALPIQSGQSLRIRAEQIAGSATVKTKINASRIRLIRSQALQ